MKSSHKLWLQLCTLQWPTYWYFIIFIESTVNWEHCFTVPSHLPFLENVSSLPMCACWSRCCAWDTLVICVYVRNGSDSLLEPETKGVQSSIPNMWLTGASNSIIGCSCGRWKRSVTYFHLFLNIKSSYSHWDRSEAAWIWSQPRT